MGLYQREESDRLSRYAKENSCKNTKEPVRQKHQELCLNRRVLPSTKPVALLFLIDVLLVHTLTLASWGSVGLLVSDVPVVEVASGGLSCR